MDTTNSVSSMRRRIPTKRRKPDKKSPIKVVYISNPTKISTTAAEFRALVQGLTGRDAESLPDPSRFRDSRSDDSDSVGGGGSAGSGGGGHQTDNCETKNGDDESDRSTSDGIVKPQVEAKAYDPLAAYEWEGQLGSTMEWFDAFDDADGFTTQIMDNFSVFHESSQQADYQALHAGFN